MVRTIVGSLLLEGLETEPETLDAMDKVHAGVLTTDEAIRNLIGKIRGYEPSSRLPTP